VKTYNYDYVFALAADTVNAILASNLAGVHQTIRYSAVDQDTGSTVTLNAELAPWQMVRGGGNTLINLNLPIATGSLTLTGGAITGSYDLAGVIPEMVVTLGWVGAGSQQAAQGSGDLTHLTFDPDPSKDKQNPGYVATAAIQDPARRLDDVARGILGQLMPSALFANRDKVAYVFANVDPTPAGLASWLTPGQWQYFVSQDATGSPVLCFLCMLGSGAFPAQPAFDASALQQGAGSVILVSQTAFFRNVVLPAVQRTFSGGSFALSSTGESAKIVNTSGFDVGKVATSSYSLTASPAGTGLAVASSGGGPLKFLFGLADLPDASYSWSLSAVNPASYAGGQISFTADPHPVINQDHTIYWYDWLLLAVLGIVNVAGLISAIYDLVNNFADEAQNAGMSNVNSNVQAATGGTVMNLAQVIHWTKSGQTLTPVTAGMNEAVYVAGNLAVPHP
jgi:hypothetical protein